MLPARRSSGHVLATTELDDGLTLQKVSCALGVVAVIFESRPDVLPQVGSLAIKTGNGLVLKGGAEARQTNRVLVSIWHQALNAASPSLRPAICAITDRADVARILEMELATLIWWSYADRRSLNYVFEHSRIPVLGDGSGICHIYVDSAADLKMAKEVIVDAKSQYPAACNSVEKVLVHQAVAQEFLPAARRPRLQSKEVEVRGCSRTSNLLSNSQIIPCHGTRLAH